MGSTRLRGKALLSVGGKPMLERMIERVRRSSAIDDIIIATTILKEDDQLESLASRLGVGCTRGPVDDVLGRVNEAVISAQTDRVVGLLGDNPLVHADLIDDVVAFFESGGYEFAVNVTTEQPHAPPEAARFPIGVRVEVYRPAVIERAAREATDASHREHFTSYLTGHPELFRLGYLEAEGKWSGLNSPDLTFAVNYAENLEMMERLFSLCYSDDANFSLHRVVAAFRAHPELAALMGVPASATAR